VNFFVKALKTVILIFLVIFVFLNTFYFKSQNKIVFVSISAIISILLLLVKFTILPPNYVIA